MMRDADMISIHAPHTRSDSLEPRPSAVLLNFNPRPSYEERLDTSTPEGRFMISIHAPHTRSDMTRYAVPLAYSSFQSTPLIRGATIFFHMPPDSRLLFQSTPLIRGATAARHR